MNYLFSIYLLFVLSFLRLKNAWLFLQFVSKSLTRDGGFHFHYMKILCLNFKVYFFQTLFELPN